VEESQEWFWSFCLDFSETWVCYSGWDTQRRFGSGMIDEKRFMIDINFRRIHGFSSCVCGFSGGDYAQI